jgi:hypothetical protein
MKSPLPCVISLELASTGYVLYWSCSELPAVWRDKVALSGRIALAHPTARACSEALFGVIWATHRSELGVVGRGLELRTSGASS